jgi:hypothetical protein
MSLSCERSEIQFGNYLCDITQMLLGLYCTTKHELILISNDEYSIQGITTLSVTIVATL